MKSFHQRLGPHAMVDVPVMKDMPQYNLYKDESQNVETFPYLDEEPEVTLEWGDQYLMQKYYSQEETRWLRPCGMSEKCC